MKRLRTESPPLILPDLVHLVQGALRELQPVHWIRPLGDASVLCWGKAALETARALGPVKIPSIALGISSEADSVPAGWRWVKGEHPLPGAGSFAAGAAILEFFDSLRRMDARKLDIYLSGGASSLAWIPKGGMPREELVIRLRELYAKPLSIEQLNRERARLCQLKAGGAAGWLRWLAPKVKARVFVVSDVLPAGVKVVGSGPFWGDRISHRVVADNASWVSAIARGARARGLKVLSGESGVIGPWQEWVEQLSASARGALRRNQQGLIICGGEPQVDLRGMKNPGRGGRQTQIGAGLLLELAPEIRAGRVEVLCLSSDGVDGNSRAAGAWLNRRVAMRSLSGLEQAIARMDSAGWLARRGGLVRSRATGTNVQDVVLMRFS